MERAPSAPSPPHKAVQHEPISFGIDQILSSGADSESGRTSSGDGYLLGSPTGGSAASYTALSISLSGMVPQLEDPGLYGVNHSLGSRGVIRVPAHRPLTVEGPPHVGSAVPGYGGLCFPWVGYRFAKDRLSGNFPIEPLAYSPSNHVYSVYIYIYIPFQTQ